MDRFQQLIDGVFEDGAQGFDSLDPATGTPWARMPMASAADVDRAVRAAHRAFHAPEWAGLTATARGKLLNQLADLVQAGDASAVLSIGVSFGSNAHLAAVYGVDILTGKAQAGALKVGTISPPDIAINFRRARAIGLKIPFSFFESASTIYDGDGKLVRAEGRVVHDP